MATKEQLIKELVIYAADEAANQKRSTINTVMVDQPADEWQSAHDVNGYLRASLRVTDVKGEVLDGLPAGILAIDPENRAVRYSVRLSNTTDYHFVNTVYNALFIIGDRVGVPPAEQSRKWISGKNDDQKGTTITFSRNFPADHQMRDFSLEATEYAAALKAISHGRISLSPV